VGRSNLPGLCRGQWTGEGSSRGCVDSEGVNFKGSQPQEVHRESQITSVGANLQVPYGREDCQEGDMG
jgi:hypothetical protein